MRTRWAACISGCVFAHLADESHHRTRREQHDTSSPQEERITWTSSRVFGFRILALERREEPVSSIGPPFFSSVSLILVWWHEISDCNPGLVE